MRNLILSLALIVGLPSIAAAQYPAVTTYRIGPFGRVHGYTSLGYGVPVGGFGVSAYGPYTSYSYRPASFGVRYVPLGFGAFDVDPCHAAPVPVAPPAAFGVRTFYYSGW